MEIAIGYDTTIQKNGTVFDAYRELVTDTRDAKENKQISSIRYIKYPSNLPPELLEKLKEVAGCIRLIPSTPVKQMADGTEENLPYTETMIKHKDGGPTITVFKF